MHLELMIWSTYEELPSRMAIGQYPMDTLSWRALRCLGDCWGPLETIGDHWRPLGDAWDSQVGRRLSDRWETFERRSKEARKTFERSLKDALRTLMTAKLADALKSCLAALRGIKTIDFCRSLRCRLYIIMQKDNSLCSIVRPVVAYSTNAEGSRSQPLDYKGTTVRYNCEGGLQVYRRYMRCTSVR